MTYLLILVMNWFGTLVRRWNIIIAVCTFLLIVWLVATVSPYHSYDTLAYQEVYGWLPTSERFEKGYMWISYTMYRLGFSFTEFRLIVVSVSYLLFFVGLRLLTSNTTGFFSIYLVLPFMNDITNFRNTIMMGFVVLAFGVIFRFRDVYGYSLAIILIYIGGQIQATSFFFLIGIMMTFLKLKTVKKIAFVGLTAGYSLFFLLLINPSNSLFSWILSNVSSLVGRSDSLGIVNTFGQGDGKLKALFIAGFFLTLIVIMNIQIYYRNVQETKNATNSLTGYTYTLVVSAFLIIPMLASSFFFERIIRDVFVFFIIGFTAFFENNVYDKIEEKTKIQRLRIIVGVLFFVAIILFLLPEKYLDFSDNGRGNYIPYMIKLLEE